MFNPFKKKDDDMSAFSMNEQELPSLNDMDSNSSLDNSTQNNDLPDLPQLPDLNSPTQSQTAQQDPNAQFDSTPGIGSLSQNNEMPTFNQPEPTQQSNSFANEQSGRNGSSANQDMHNEISKAKLEAMSTKMELLEHKVNSMDYKLDMILKLINAEVSTETKIKLGLQDKLNNLK